LSVLKIFRKHFSTFVLTRGLTIALLGSSFLYLSYWGFYSSLLNTLLGLLTLLLLLPSQRNVWFWSGFFFGLFWFWWISISFIHYQMPWAIPFIVLLIALIYGGIFWLIATLAKYLPQHLFTPLSTTRSSLLPLIIKAWGLWSISYLHPFGFNWFKVELMFVESDLGIAKWQFALILLSLVLTLWKKKLLFLLLLLFAIDPIQTQPPTAPSKIALVNTHTPVEEKWDKKRHPKQFQHLFASIEHAIENHQSIVVLPESAFPVFLNLSTALLSSLREKSKQIAIVTGALYWDGKTPRNATFIFNHGEIHIANKVVLVPFGERNPLPDFLSDWVNKVFYDGAVDYKADSHITDYTIQGEEYRNAICFEACSEILYQETPKKMIVLSNNGWFTPSIEPTLQKLLLQYYSRKYGTTIYHATNMSPAYSIHNGQTRSLP